MPKTKIPFLTREMGWTLLEIWQPSYPSKNLGGSEALRPTPTSGLPFQLSNKICLAQQEKANSEFINNRLTQIDLPLQP